MLKSKPKTKKGKLSLTRYFQKFQPGESVAVTIELSQIFGYSKRLQGKTGKVKGKQGNAYIVEIKDIKKPKTYSIKPIHLRKIQ